VFRCITAFIPSGQPPPYIPRRLVRPLLHVERQPEYRRAGQDGARRRHPSDGTSLPLSRSTGPCRNHANVHGRSSSHYCSTSGVTIPRPQMLSLSPRVSSQQHRTSLRRGAGSPERPPPQHNKPSTGRLAPASSLALQPVDELRRLSLGQIRWDVLPGLSSQRLEVATLRSSHRLVTGDPVLRVLLR
jgi:hypothetical protein